MQANKLAMYGPKLDLQKGLSYGVQNSAQNMIDERAKADKITWEIKNTRVTAQYLVLSPLFIDTANPTIFDSVADMLSKVLPDVASDDRYAFKSGRLAGDADNELAVSSKTAGRDIEQLLRYTAQNPTRITKIRIKSTTVAGGADLGNFDNEIKTLFFSPFAQPVEKQLPLSPLVKTDSNFSPNIVTADFVDEAFPLIMSNEHFTVLQINPGTILNLTVSFGAQDSKAQRFWRTIKNADDIIRAEGIK